MGTAMGAEEEVMMDGMIVLEGVVVAVVGLMVEKKLAAFEERSDDFFIIPIVSLLGVSTSFLQL